MFELFIYSLIIFTTVLLSLNSMPVSFHFKKFWRDAALNDEASYFKGKFFSSIIISAVFTVLSFIYVLNLYDIISNFEIITIGLLTLTVVLSTKVSMWEVIDNNLRDEIKSYFNNLITAFLYALLFSAILATFYYIGFDPSNYQQKHELSDSQPNLYKIFVIINSLKTEFYTQIIPYVEENIIKLIFTFLTFTQSFFMFYYTSIIVGAYKNIRPIKDKVKTVTYPFLISIIIIAPIFYYEPLLLNGTQKVNNDVQTAKDVRDETRQNNIVLNMTIQELQNKNAILQNDLLKSQKDFTSFKNAPVELNTMATIRCLLWDSDCTVVKLIKTKD